MSQCPPPATQILGSLAIEQLNDLVYVFDRQFRLRYVNDTACRILGYAREELLAASAAVIGAADPTSQEAGIAPGWNIGEQYTAETSLVSRDSRVIPVEISARVIDHAGEPLRVVVARDMIGQSVESFSVGRVLNRTDVIGCLCKVIQDGALQEYEVRLRTAAGERVYLARAVLEFDSVSCAECIVHSIFCSRRSQ